MARKNTQGTKQLAAELDADLVDQFKAFCVDRGDTVRKHLEMAIRRHLGNPPPKPVDAPPLPPITVDVVTEEKTAQKGKPKKGG